MATMRGEKVIVRAWGNRPLVRVIWDVCKDSVLVTNEHGLAALESGNGGPMPIGFSFSDVFVYEDVKAEAAMSAYASGMSPQWGSLQRFTD